MARVGDIWDGTTEVLAGRAGVLAPIAVGALYLPAMAQAALRAFSAPAGAVWVPALVAILVALLALWGRLAITAVALDPATDGASARGQAARRLPNLIGVLLVLGAAGVVLLIPFAVVLSQAGFDWSTLRAGSRPVLPVLGRATAAFTSLYMLALAALGLWVLARIKLLLGPVVLREGRTIGAIGRAAALSRGMTWRLIGVVLLYYVLLWVCVSAVTLTAGVVFRLVLGQSAWAGLLATMLGAAVGTLFDTIAQVFGARLYATVTAGSAQAAA